MEAAQSRLTWAISQSRTLGNRAVDRFMKLGFYGKAAFVAWVALHFIVLFAVWIITPATLFEWLALGADELREMQYGEFVLLAMILFTSFPPIFGYGTCITLCGFAFGVGKGWVVAATGCMLGSVLSFLLCRRLIGQFAPFLAKQPLFRALSTAVRDEGGLHLIILIRLAPFPFPYSNLFFASIESISLYQFMVATVAITPKLFLHVWVGSRMYLFADPTSRRNMDTTTKIINGVYVLAGMALGAFTSYYLYKLTMQHVHRIGLEDDEHPDLEAALLNDVDEMLDGEEREDEDDGEAEREDEMPTPRPGAVRSNTAGSVASSSANSGPKLNQVVVPRKSEDHWENSFSDFGEDEDEHDHQGGQSEGLGIQLETLKPVIDKRRD